MRGSIALRAGQARVLGAGARAAVILLYLIMSVLSSPLAATRSDPMGGALWMLGSAVFFAAMTAMIR